eukprot:Clim_evm4s178 gene=Clim_evmTU4s178
MTFAHKQSVGYQDRAPVQDTVLNISDMLTSGNDSRTPIEGTGMNQEERQAYEAQAMQGILDHLDEQEHRRSVTPRANRIASVNAGESSIPFRRYVAPLHEGDQSLMSRLRRSLAKLLALPMPTQTVFAKDLVQSGPWFREGPEDSKYRYLRRKYHQGDLTVKWLVENTEVPMLRVLRLEDVAIRALLQVHGYGIGLSQWYTLKQFVSNHLNVELDFEVLPDLLLTSVNREDGLDTFFFSTSSDWHVLRAAQTVQIIQNMSIEYSNAETRYKANLASLHEQYNTGVNPNVVHHHYNSDRRGKEWTDLDMQNVLNDLDMDDSDRIKFMQAVKQERASRGQNTPTPALHRRKVQRKSTTSTGSLATVAGLMSELMSKEYVPSSPATATQLRRTLTHLPSGSFSTEDGADSGLLASEPTTPAEERAKRQLQFGDAEVALMRDYVAERQELLVRFANMLELVRESPSTHPLVMILANGLVGFSVTLAFFDGRVMDGAMGILGGMLSVIILFLANMVGLHGYGAWFVLSTVMSWIVLTIIKLSGAEFCYDPILASSILFFVPGITIAIGAIELAERHLLSGVAKLIDGIVGALFLAGGLEAGKLITQLCWGVSPSQISSYDEFLPQAQCGQSTSYHPFYDYLCIAGAMLGAAFLTHTHPRQLPTILINGVAVLGLTVLLRDIATFATLAVSVLLVWICDLEQYFKVRPITADFTLPLLILVPGSASLRLGNSIFSSSGGLGLIQPILITAVSIAAGVSIGNALLPHRLVRHLRLPASWHNDLHHELYKRGNIKRSSKSRDRRAGSGRGSSVADVEKKHDAYEDPPMPLADAHFSQKATF